MNDRKIRHAIKEIVLRQNYLYSIVCHIPTNVNRIFINDPFLRDCKVLDEVIKDE